MDRGRRWLPSLTGPKHETPEIKRGASNNFLPLSEDKRTKARISEDKRRFPHSPAHPGLELAISWNLVLAGPLLCDVPARALAGGTSERGHRTRRRRTQFCLLPPLPALMEQCFSHGRTQPPITLWKSQDSFFWKTA